jgi:hypothetical protein
LCSLINYSLIIISGKKNCSSYTYVVKALPCISSFHNEIIGKVLWKVENTSLNKHSWHVMNKMLFSYHQMQNLLQFSFHGLSSGSILITFGLVQWNIIWYFAPSLLGQK